MTYNPEIGLEIADYSLVVCYFVLIGLQVFIIACYLVPLRIKSLYIILFYVMLFLLLSSSTVELLCRISNDDPGYMVNTDHGITVGDYARHISTICYVILGFILSATMFQLSVSLALVLDIIDLEEANKRKWTYNICLLVISLVYVFCSGVEIRLDKDSHREHMVFEVLGMIVLCLIYFSTIVDLLRKLRIFVLEEAKLEAWFVRVQFCIFFLAYGSKVITEMYWIKNPPHERKDVLGFLLNTDVMELVWILFPITFLLAMDIRSFRKMRKEKNLLNLVTEKPYTTHDPSPSGSFNGQMNRSELLQSDSSATETQRASESSNNNPVQSDTSPRRPSKFGRMSSQTNALAGTAKESFCCSTSIPESTTSMQEYFGQQSSFAEQTPNHLELTNMQQETTQQRSESVEDDLRMIRQVGVTFLKSSTQGYQLLMANERMKQQNGNVSGHTSVRHGSFHRLVEQDRPTGNADDTGEEQPLARSYDQRALQNLM